MEFSTLKEFVGKEANLLGMTVEDIDIMLLVSLSNDNYFVDLQISDDAISVTYTGKFEEYSLQSSFTVYYDEDWTYNTVLTYVRNYKEFVVNVSKVYDHLIRFDDVAYSLDLNNHHSPNVSQFIKQALLREIFYLKNETVILQKLDK